MLNNILVDGFLITVITICLWTDIKERKIYNKITFPAILIALTFNSYFSGLSGVLFSLKGLFLGTGLIILPFILGGIGAGDVKLIMVVGGLKGAYFVFYATLATFIVGGLVSVVLLIRKKSFISTVEGLLFNFLIAYFSKTRFKVDGNIHSAKAITFPYGIAIFGGTLLALMVV